MVEIIEVETIGDLITELNKYPKDMKLGNDDDDFPLSWDVWIKKGYEYETNKKVKIFVLGSAGQLDYEEGEDKC
jgi:hypothetical protein